MALILTENCNDEVEHPTPQMDKQMAQKTSQLAEAQAAIAHLQANGSAADAALSSMMLQNSQQAEQVADLQQEVLRSAVTSSTQPSC